MGKISGLYVFWSLGTIILIAAPQKSECLDPMTAFKGAMSVLGPFVDSYLADLRAKREAEKIKIRMWMHNGDTKLNGCGFYFRATGYAGGVAEDWLPRNTEHKCGNDKYEMRMTSQSAMYDKTIHLGNEQVKDIELHADGYHNTFVNVVCIGLNERTIAGGPRAFCLNNDLLKACKDLYNKWDNINIDFNDILLTRTSRGAHKIIFTDVTELINAFEKLARNRDDNNAVQAACDRINLVRGTLKDEYWDCPAKKVWTTAHGAGNFYSWEKHSKAEDKNPYGCDRFTDR